MIHVPATPELRCGIRLCPPGVKHPQIESASCKGVVFAKACSATYLGQIREKVFVASVTTLLDEAKSFARLFQVTRARDANQIDQVLAVHCSGVFRLKAPSSR